MSNYNWTAAFVSFCNNNPLEEIAEALDIPLSTLKAKCNADKWYACRDQLPLGALNVKVGQAADIKVLGPSDPFHQTREQTALEPSTALPLAVQAKMQVMARNREVNYETAQKFQMHLGKLLDKMLSEEGLEMEQLYHNKGSVVRTTRQLSPADLVNLATYARIVQDMGYRALGDIAAQDSKGTDNPAGHQPSGPAIVINLPGAIAQPRQNRVILDTARKAGAEIIEIRSEVVDPLPVTPVPDHETDLVNKRFQSGNEDHS